jgi:eukaryotic-like serine/threonine-protein kinase
MKPALPASDWERMQRLFFEAADLPPGERDRFLESACADDQRLRSELESLLRTDLAKAHDFDAIVAGVAHNMVGADPLVGTRFGPWRVVSELGRGGMGVVYLAVRDDDQFQKQVALKLVKYGMDSAELLGRFRHERQILASLDHPYIARLIDGGSGPTGQPFLAMEYVAGDRIDTWCQMRQLSIAARCRLMLKVCEAVSYAHRNLVVHRDLKPGNILITADGVPKLLDFGVAKLLAPDSHREAAATTALQRVLTPEYASPEQVLGQPVTTATDVYSLGAILYELLSGKRAHRLNSVTPAEVERAVCQTAISRPSEVLDRSQANFAKLRREISGDLDNIVLMAMRKEPGRRYSSVEQLAEDLRRFLEGHPVAARQDSLGYTAGKFVRRHRVEVTAALLVFVSLVGGMVLAISEWRQAVTARHAADAQRAVAERERTIAETARQSEAAQHRIADEQRDAAVLERARAEQRLTDLIDLAGKTLFDVHDAINTVPGAVNARQKIVGITLEYLQRLEKDHGLDDRVRLVLAAAYYKIGRIQGDTDHPSLQDAASAERSFKKAEALLAPLYAQKPGDPGVMMEWLDVETSLAEAAIQSANPEKGRDQYLKLLPLAHRVSQLSGIGEVTAHEESRIYSRLSYVEGNRLGHSDAGLEYSNRAIALLTALVPRFPGDFDLQASLAGMNASKAQKLNQLGRLEESAAVYKDVIREREELLEKHPNDVDLRANLLICYGNYAVLLGMPWAANLGRPEEARVYAAKSLTLARELAKADPQDATAQLNLSLAMAHMAMIDPEPGRMEESLQSLEEALAILEPIAKGSPKSAPLAGYVGMNREYIARRLWSLNRRTEAEAMFRKSMDAAAAFRSPDGSYSQATAQDMRCLEAMARFYAEVGDRERTVQAADRALAAAQSYVAAEPSSERRQSALANMHFERASAFRTLGDWEKTRAEAEQAVTIWRGIHDPGASAQFRANIPLAEALLREAASRTAPR